MFHPFSPLKNVHPFFSVQTSSSISGASSFKVAPKIDDAREAKIVSCVCFQMVLSFRRVVPCPCRASVGPRNCLRAKERNKLCNFGLKCSKTNLRGRMRHGIGRDVPLMTQRGAPYGKSLNIRALYNGHIYIYRL